MQRAVTQKRQIKAIKGVRDILPPESALWNRVEQTARDVFATYGYGEIRLPIFEQSELFARAVGEQTDIVSKEMYSFPDPFDPQELALVAFRGLKQYGPEKFSQLVEKDPEQAESVIHSILSRAPLWHLISLRPEATASVCRAYIEHGMQTLPGDVKLYYIGPMFRRERPQKGRYRQFYQIGAEVLGQSDAPAIDAEVIEMLMAFFDRVGLTDCTLHLNSIGCRDCRPKYVEKLREALLKVKDKLGADSQRRIETNPLRVLDSKLPEEQAIIEKLPRISEHLCAACREHFAALQEQLKLRGIAYEINWRLVRGLDYYMRTTFEITAPGLGAQNAVCGGGRYDGLVELLGGPPTKGIGFAIGTDRVVMSIQDARTESDFVAQMHEFPDVVVAGTTDTTWPTAARLSSLLRRNGLRVYTPTQGTRLAKVLNLASRVGISVALIVGENELKDNQLTIRVLQPFDESLPRDGRISERDASAYGKLLKVGSEIETWLRELGRQNMTYFAGSFGISQMVVALEAKGLIQPKVANELRDFVAIRNSSVHGQTLTSGSIESTVVKGYLLVAELRKLIAASGNQ